MRATVLALAAAVAPVLAIPPTEFKFPDAPNNTELSVAYSFSGQTRVVTAASLYGSNITSQQPQIAIDQRKFKSLADYKGEYIVVMVDPDAPTPENPTARFILHWLMTSVVAQSNAGSNSSLAGQMLLQPKAGKAADVAYASPAPPPTSSAHRYIIYAFAQPSNFTMPAAFSNFSAQNRAGFNINNFVTAAKLGNPLAAEYFYVSRQANVPGTFVDKPGGTFPGGNGGAIFAGNATSGGGSTTSPTTTKPSGATATPTSPGSSSTPSALAVRPAVGLGGLLGAGVLGLVALL